MNRILTAAALFVLSPLLLPAQGDVVPARQRGTIFKSEVDRLVEALREQSVRDKAPLGGSSALASAQILCAMGHCHRKYSIQDGPVVRPSVHQLFEQRSKDGSFGASDPASQVALTGWVADALATIDGDGCRNEIADAQAWLGKRGAAVSPWQDVVSEVLQQVRSDKSPQHLGQPTAAAVQQLLDAKPATVEPLPAAGMLVHLVACQAANRLLDKAQGSQPAAFSPTQAKAFQWLLGQQQDGVFFAEFGGKKFPDEGFTGFGLQGLMTKPRALRSVDEQAVIEKGLRWLLARQNADGSWGKQTINYVTSVVVGAIARWDAPEAKAALMKAQAFLLAIQNAEDRGYQKSDRDYGSMGYGGGETRGDLSNLNFALQALRTTGLPAENEAFARAVVFLQRTQNLKSVNDFTGKMKGDDGKLVEVVPGDDGGSAYYPGNSEFGFIELPDGKKMPRSYGSMTYALLKAYSLCGIHKDDPRVQAAAKWVQEHWSLTENPGYDPAGAAKDRYAGLFYYYMVLSQALDLCGIDQVTTTGKDGKPVSIDWRKALREHLQGMQQADGSWLNEKNSRWYESMQMICTSYAMLALERCR